MATGVRRQGLTFTDGHPLRAVTSKHTPSDWDWPHAHMRESMESISASSLRLLLQRDIYCVSFVATMLFKYYTYY
jgi:hypothetical protein